jgi:hypothetical protein
MPSGLYGEFAPLRRQLAVNPFCCRIESFGSLFFSLFGLSQIRF